MMYDTPRAQVNTFWSELSLTAVVVRLRAPLAFAGVTSAPLRLSAEHVPCIK